MQRKTEKQEHQPYLKLIFSGGKSWFSTAEPKRWLGRLQSLGGEVKASSLLYSRQKFKPLSDNCQRRSGRESAEAWPSTGRSLQDISDMPLWLLKRSLNIHLEVSLIRQNTGVCSLYRSARRGRIAEKWSKMSAEIVFPSWAREDFALILQKKNDVKWSDNALRKPVIPACPLSAEKYRCTISWDNMH